jgi:hypothetical protein
MAINEAFRRLEELRNSHNGIMSVEVFMGHDGHNSIKFRDYDGVIAEGDGGRTLLDTVNRAESDWRFRKLIGTAHGHRTVEDVVQVALEKFGSPLVFNTACFQTAINTDAYAQLLDEHCLQLLMQHPRIVRLKGGCHWLWLPDGFTRYDDVDVCAKCGQIPMGKGGEYPCSECGVPTVHDGKECAVNEGSSVGYSPRDWKKMLSGAKP